MPRLHVHIGHHFYGSGNVGDDLMLAGFLAAARPAFLASATLTCCTPHDLASQRRRFPEVEWLPYDDGTRAACIRRCDVWLGLGDTPFQATGGHTWFLDHLCAEAAWCREAGVPMYYLGVGVNERAVVDYEQTRVLVAQAERLWLRDEDSLAVLSELLAPGQASAHADLAHLALADMSFPPPGPDTLGFVLNFEDSAQCRPEHLTGLIQAVSHGRQARWLVQEVRALPGSETFLYGQLPSTAQARAPLRMPAYADAASARALLTAWEEPDSFFVSRYHAALIGAWKGAPVAVFARNDKVAGAARQFGLPTVAGMDDPDAILRAVQAARPVERHLLLGLAERSRAACEEFFALASTLRGRRPAPAPAAGSVQNAFSPVVFSSMPPPPPVRILFLRPDAYGDLFLFEPMLRIVRDAWPRTEVAVLVRQPYADAAPLLAAGGVRWLTTACNPYRHGPSDDPAALAALRETVQAFAPDCLVAACAEQTWLEAAVASFLPQARQVGLGPGLTDPLTRAALDRALPVEWNAIYPEKIPVETADHEWEKTLRLAGALLGREVPRWWPMAQVSADAGERAAQVVAAAGLTAGEFVVCAGAGTANVSIKSWPAESYGQTLAWLEREHGIRALLVGHISEQTQLETLRQTARGHGAAPALWAGQDGEMPILGGLLAAARFYFGNDTGALHLAAALGRPVVPVFGGGTWPRFRPVARRSLTVVQPLPCFGCGWDCFYGDAPCVRTISVASVQRALAQFLADDAESQTVFEAEGLDAGARAIIDTATPRLRFQREDSVARLRQTRELTALLNASEADRAARQVQVNELTTLLATSEADRAARQVQVNELTTLLATSEADRAARRTQVDELTALLKNTAADSAARLRQVDELVALLHASEADRDARQTQVDELTALLQAIEPDHSARGEQIEQLTSLLATSESDRDARQTQIDELTRLFKASEADRSDRSQQIEQLTAWLRESETDRAARGEQIATLTAWLVNAQTEAEAPDEPALSATSKLTPPPTSGTPMPVLPGGGGEVRHAGRKKIS